MKVIKKFLMIRQISQILFKLVEKGYKIYHMIPKFEKISGIDTEKLINDHIKSI